MNADRLIDMASEGSLNDVSNPLEMDAMLFLSDSSVYIAESVSLASHSRFNYLKIFCEINYILIFLNKRKY